MCKIFKKRFKQELIELKYRPIPGKKHQYYSDVYVDGVFQHTVIIQTVPKGRSLNVERSL